MISLCEMFDMNRSVYHRPTKVEMAMKQIRLDISKSTMQQILMELEVLNRSNSPYIVEFYGGFFVDSSVYLCMEVCFD